MNMDTGEIVSEDEVKKLSPSQQKRFIGIPESELAFIQGMNRHERRRWAAEQRRKK